MIYGKNISTLISRHELLWAWTMRILRARYKQSFLGVLWAVIQPLAAVFIFTVIFTRFVPIDTGDTPYIIFSYTAMVPWTLFTTSVTQMVASLVTNMNLVNKIYFPREILPIAALCGRLFDFAIAEAILILLLIVYRVPISPALWLLIPVVLLAQLMLALGIGLFGAALNVFYRDVHHIFVLVLQLWLYASPIIYPASNVPDRFRQLYYLNPMAGIIEAYRAIILHRQMPDDTFLLALAISFVVMVGGYWFFKRVEFQFADIV